MTRRSLLAAIFLSSLSCLGYEIALTRIFTISLYHHFAFMIISIAMLGIGASGTVLSRRPALKAPGLMPRYCLFLGLSLTMGYLAANRVPFDPAMLAWDKTQLLFISLYYLALSPPFFFFGLIMASAFSSASGESGVLYAADLLGAGTGSLGILLILSHAPPESAVFVLSCAPLAAAALLGGRWIRAAAVILILASAAVAAAGPSFARARISPYKGLPLALQYPGAKHLETFLSPFSRIDSFTGSAARLAPGLSLTYLDPIADQIGLALDGTEITAITRGDDEEALSFLGRLPSALPYEVGRTEDVLVADPRGGLQVLLARTAGAGRIHKVESDPLFIKVVGEIYAGFSGDIYREDTRPGLARSWLMAGKELVDIIDIPLAGAVPSGSFGIAEDFRFTVEAFREYLGHLKPGGIISMSLFIIPPPRTELRLLSTAVAALEEMGVREPALHIAAIRGLETICILVKKTPLSEAEIASLKRFASDMRFDLVHYPGMQEGESNVYIKMRSNEYFRAFRAIMDQGERQGFLDSYLFDVRPVRDDSPFFHFYLRLRNIAEAYRVTDGKWEFFIEGGYILPVVLLQVFPLGLALIFLSGGRKGWKRGAGDRIMLSYFGFIGIGFMFVEMPLIQNMILPLERPPYAVAAVLASILVSSGIGSLIFQKKVLSLSPGVLLAVAAVSVLYSVVPHLLWRFLISLPSTARFFLIFPILLPLGILMGIPFPMGMQLLGESRPALIPRAWAVNGCLSVMAPVVAAMLATVLGFGTVLVLGAVSYCMAFLCLSVSLRPLRSSAQRPQAPAVRR